LVASLAESRERLARKNPIPGEILSLVPLAAVLAREFVNPPVCGFAKPRIVPAQREHLRTLNNLIDPADITVHRFTENREAAV
jgi:hypothetical protein